MVPQLSLRKRRYVIFAALVIALHPEERRNRLAHAATIGTVVASKP